MIDELVTSEMEAMLLFKQHGKTWWHRHECEWMLGERAIDHRLVRRMEERGLILTKILPAAIPDTPERNFSGAQYVLAEKFR